MTPTIDSCNDPIAKFQALSKTPSISWPAVNVFFLGWISIAICTWSALSGFIPYWSAMLINGVALYFFFSVLHESIHLNLSSNKRFNELMGRIALAALVPAAPLEVARWVHLRHHVNTSCDNDPDNFMHHGKWWALPFFWANLDLFYIVHFFRFGGATAKRHQRKVISYLVVFASLVSILVYVGLGYELIMLWIIPTRIGLALVGFIFVFLPHYPADISAKESKFQATTVRLGWEWLLTPLMVYQNYHLIHHLHPNIPFYNYIKVWRLKYDEILASDPAIQTAFGLLPTNRRHV